MSAKNLAALAIRAAAARLGCAPDSTQKALFWVLLPLPCHQYVFIQTPFVQEKGWVLLLQKLEGFLP